MSAYCLPQFVYLCFTRDGAVFLDVRHDRYLGLECDQAQALRGILAGEPAPGGASLADELVAAGVLAARANEASKPAVTQVIPHPRTLLFEPSDVPRASWLQIGRFVSACVAVWLSLHAGSLEYAIRCLEARKRKVSSTRVTMDEIGLLVSIFNRLRTYAYTARDHCLFDSFVMADFLRRFGVAATCVFGVRTLPFGAHCWVQVDSALISESASVEYIATYSPILTI